MNGARACENNDLRWSATAILIPLSMVALFVGSVNRVIVPEGATASHN